MTALLGLLLAEASYADSDGKRAAKPRLDLYGDVLPDGAIARLGSSRLRHGDNLLRVGFTTDCRTLISAGDDGQVRFWDVGTGKLLRARPGFAASPDGKIVAVQDEKDLKTVVLVDADTGKERTRFPCPDATSGPFVFSPDGSVVGCVTRKWTAGLRDTKTGRIKEQVRTDWSKESSIVFSADSKYVAGFRRRDGGGFTVYEVGSGKEALGAFRSRGRGQVFDLAFSPDGQTLVSSWDDGTLRLWLLQARKELWRTKVKAVHTPSAVAFGRGGKLAVSGEQDGVIRFWDPETAAERRKFTVSPGVGREQWAFSADGALAASWGPEERKRGGAQRSTTTIKLWDLDSGKERFAPAGHESGIRGLGLSRDGKVVATAAGPEPIRLWDAASGKELARMANDRAAWYCGPFLLPDKKALVASRENGAVTVFDATTGKARLDWPGAIPYGRGYCALSPDGKVLAQIMTWGEVRLVRVSDGEAVSSLPGHEGFITQVAFSPDGRRLAVGGYRVFPDKPSTWRERAPGWVSVWDVESREVVTEWCGADIADVAALAFSPDGRSVVTSGKWDGALALYEVATGGKRAEWHTGPAPTPGTLPTNGVYRAAISANGRLLAAGGRGRLVYLFDLTTGKEIRRLRCDGVVHGLAFHGSDILVSGDGSGCGLVWDVNALVGLRKPSRETATAAELEVLWGDLASEDAGRAYAASQKLCRLGNQAVKLLAAKLRPADKAEEWRRHLDRVVKQLDDDSSAVRKKASEELLVFGKEAIPRLRRAARSGSAEVRRRATAVIVELSRKRWLPETLRAIRAVEALERVNSSAAVAAIRALSRGDEGAVQTQEALDSLTRLRILDG